MSFKTSLKTYLLKNVVRDLTPGTENSLFFFIARAEDWPGAFAPEYVDSKESLNDVYRRMITAKKISSTEACLVAPANDWKSGSTYDMYTSDKDLSGDIRYYVTNDNDQVYKCLKNNNGGLSTVQPLGSGTEVIKTSDGFEWKFMFSIPESLNRFRSPNVIPIRTLDVDEDDPLRYRDDRFPQYSVQYNAVDGSISTIDLGEAGGSYPAQVPLRLAGPDATSFTDAQNDSPSSGTSFVKLGNANASDVDGFYNGYQLRIVAGEGTGQLMDIIGYTGVTKKLVLGSNFGVLPDTTTSKYEIIPAIGISGDGTGGAAIAVMNGGPEGFGFISGVELQNTGRDYTYVSADVTTANPGDGTTLDAYLAPSNGHGSDPEAELLATKLMILVRIEKESSGITGNNRDGDLPLRNDYHQYGIIRNPIYATGNRAGEVAGIDSGSFTDIVVDAPTGDVFGNGDLLPGDFVVGYTSKSAGEVHRFARSTDTRRAIITLRDNKSSFSAGELIVGMSATGEAGTVWSSTGKGYGYYKYSEDTVPVLTNDTYRLTTRLVVETTGANVGENWTPTSVSLDDVVTGASGSTARVVEFVPHPSAVTADLYVTNIVRPSDSAPAFGFTFGEQTTDLSKVAKINEIYIPEFSYGSGDVLYIKNAASIERNIEQEEEFKITLDI